MFPTHSPTKTRTHSPLRRLATAAATTLLAAGGLTGLGAIAASPAHAASARPADTALYTASCNDSEISGQSYPAYPIACTAPSFPLPWNDTPGSHTQSTVITLRNTSSATVGLTPRNFSLDAGEPNGVIESLSVPVHDLPPGKNEQAVWTVTYTAPYKVYPAGAYAPVPSVELAFGIDLSGVGTDPNAGVGWEAFYPVTNVPSTSTPAAPTYSLTASASTSSPQTGSGSTITVANTGSANEHLTLCDAGKAIAAGIHSPGTSLTHTVVESTPGTRTFTAYASGGYGCSGSSKSVSVDWTGSAPAPTPALQAPLGAPSILADGSGAALSVTALGVVDPGTGADALALPETGERLVGVAIQLANRGRSVVTDVDADTTVIGSNGQTFGHVDDPLTECTPFPLGAQTLAPGTTLRGCVTFELPLGVSVSKIAFRPTAGSVPGQAGEWNAG